MRTVLLAAAGTAVLSAGTLVLLFGYPPVKWSGHAKGAPAVAASPGAVKPPVRSPAEVTQLLQSLHQQRDYDRIGRLIVADERAASIALLEAIDRVLDTNKSLRRSAETAYSGPLREYWNLAAMANNIGPFSERVGVINQQFKGSAAVVTLQAGDNIPLIHAQFELVGSEWLYRPERSPARLTTELLALARVLQSVEASVRGGAPFESYLDAFYSRVLPQMEAVTTAQDDAPRTVAAASDE